MTIIEYNMECEDCGKPAEKYCTKCGSVLVCNQCYQTMNGLCFDCREHELNGDDE